MGTLSEVSEFLKNLENLMRDDGDSMNRMEHMVEKENFDLENINVKNDVVMELKKHKFNMTHCDNYMTKAMLEKLGFARIDYGDYGRKMAKDVGHKY
ncbi:hypothetical protein Tco_0182886 [Tanacetum coccineum]